MKKLALLLLLAAPSWAGVYWAVETVNADNVGTVDTYAAPYGIQGAFTAAVAGDEIRVVVGTDTYDSTSTSWTNRAADKSIASVSSGTSDSPIIVSCWSDETTQVTTVGGCELDFNTGTGDGFSLNHSFLIFLNIRVSNAATHGFDLTTAADDLTLYEVEVDSAGSDGLNSAGALRVYIYHSSFHGSAVGVDAFTHTLLYRNSIYGNTTGVQAVAAGPAYIVGNLIYSNTGVGIETAYDSHQILGNTVYANGGDNISMAEAGIEMVSVVSNLLVGSTGGYGLDISDAGAKALLVLGNNYYNNNLGTRRLTGSIHVDEDSTPDDAAVSFVSATDLEVSSGGALEFTFPRGTTDYAGKKGAVQSTSAGGGEHSYATVQ